MKYIDIYPGFVSRNLHIESEEKVQLGFNQWLAYRLIYEKELIEPTDNNPCPVFRAYEEVYPEPISQNNQEVNNYNI